MQMTTLRRQTLSIEVVFFEFQVFPCATINSMPTLAIQIIGYRGQVLYHVNWLNEVDSQKLKIQKIKASKIMGNMPQSAKGNQYQKWEGITIHKIQYIHHSKTHQIIWPSRNNLLEGSRSCKYMASCPAWIIKKFQGNLADPASMPSWNIVIYIVLLIDRENIYSRENFPSKTTLLF